MDRLVFPRAVGQCKLGEGAAQSPPADIAPVQVILPEHDIPNIYDTVRFISPFRILQRCSGKCSISVLNDQTAYDEPSGDLLVGFQFGEIPAYFK